MDLKCKVGDLVVLLTGRNGGGFGTVVRMLGHHPEYKGQRWVTINSSAWLVSWKHPVVDGDGVLHKECPCPDEFLQPIRGPKKPSVTIKKRKELITT